MATARQKITDQLVKMGFDEIKLFYWAFDGWYMHCTEAQHFHIGYNIDHVLDQLTREFPTKYAVLRYLAGAPDYMFDENGVMKEYYLKNQ